MNIIDFIKGVLYTLFRRQTNETQSEQAKAPHIGDIIKVNDEQWQIIEMVQRELYRMYQVNENGYPIRGTMEIITESDIIEYKKGLQ